MRELIELAKSKKLNIEQRNFKTSEQLINEVRKLNEKPHNFFYISNIPYKLGELRNRKDLTVVGIDVFTNLGSTVVTCYILRVGG